MCAKMSVPYAGHLPMDRDLFLACENGQSLSSLNSNSPALNQLNILIDEFLTHLELTTNGTTFEINSSEKVDISNSTVGIVHVP